MAIGMILAANLVLRPMHMSGKGFVFKASEIPSAFVLDEWSFTILTALGEMTRQEILENLAEDAENSAERDEVRHGLDKTLEHLHGMGLVEGSLGT